MPDPAGYHADLAALTPLLRVTLPDARIVPTALPGITGIRLGLINPDYQTGPLDPDVMQAVIASPAYWAFCWGAGLALAEFLLKHPEWVRGRRVVDLGCGSGIAAVAAARAGARSVTACDTDPQALAATAANAALNRVTVEVSADLPAHCDVLLMADVLYDKQNLPLLALAQDHADQILVADSRIHSLPDPGYRELTTIAALTYPNLGEFDEFNTARIFHWAADTSAQ